MKEKLEKILPLVKRLLHYLTLPELKKTARSPRRIVLTLLVLIVTIIIPADMLIKAFVGGGNTTDAEEVKGESTQKVETPTPIASASPTLKPTLILAPSASPTPTSIPTSIPTAPTATPAPTSSSPTATPTFTPTPTPNIATSSATPTTATSSATASPTATQTPTPTP